MLGARDFESRSLALDAHGKSMSMALLDIEVNDLPE